MLQLRQGMEVATGHRLQQFLGQGQFGEVWRALAPGGVGTALKFINLIDAAGLGQKEYAAIQRVKDVNHPNLMSPLGIWRLDREGRVLPDPPPLDIDSTTFFKRDAADRESDEQMTGPQPSMLVVAMQLASCALDSFLPSQAKSGSPAVSEPWQPLPKPRLLKYFGGIAEGLDYLNQPIHDFGGARVSLQHCDIKPANLVLMGQSALICDFGLARILNRSQATAELPAGTLPYMAPETFEGMPSLTSDLYSLAVTYYQLRTGVLPIQGRTQTEIILAATGGKLNFDRVEPTEAAILRRATAIDWRERFDTAGEFVDCLRDMNLTRSWGTANQSFGSSEMGHSPADGTTVGGLAAGSSALAKSDPGTRIFDEIPSSPSVGSLVTPATPTVVVAATPAAVVAATPTVDGHHKRLRQAAAVVLAGTVVLAIGGGWLVWNASTAVRPEPIIDPSPVPIIPVVIETPDSGKPILPPVVEPMPAAPATFADAVEALDSDPASAADLYRTWLTNEPTAGAGRVTAAIYSAHADNVEVLRSVAGGRYVTTGYDTELYLWTPVPLSPDAGLATEPPTLRRQRLAELSELVGSRHAVAVSDDGQTLWIGAGRELTAWSINPAPDRVPELLKQRTLPGSLIAVAAHPTLAGVAAVATVDRQILVVDFNATPDVVTGGTDQLVYVSQLAFDDAGRRLAVLGDYGEFSWLDWGELRQNDPASSAVKPLPATMPTLNLLCAAGPSGDAAARSVFAAGQGDVFRLRGGLAGDPPRAIRWGQSNADSPFSALAVLNRDEWTVATGTDKSSITILTGSVDSGSRVGEIDLGEGPIRALTIGSRGRWVVAGTSRAVWILDAREPQSRSLRLDLGDVSAESLAIDEATDALIVGCGNGELLVYHWGHCRLAALIGAAGKPPADSAGPAI